MENINNKQWTPATIRENVDNWSLAGDAGLLSYLQNFSDNLTTRTKNTLANVDELFNSLTDTNIALANVTNEFMNLHHTQFIENRVYEEDEIVASEVPEIKKPEEKNHSAENIELMKKVMQDGLDILSKHFERVEVPNSDSEDESEGPSIIVRPKEFFMDRPLPYVIGSDEWNTCDHIGLKRVDSSESLEDEEQLGSDSSSMSLDPIKTPESTSESSLNMFTKENVNSNLIPQDKSEKISTSQNMFESSSLSSESENYQQEKVNAKFAAELASKLGNVVQDIKHVLPNDDDVYGRPPPKTDKQDTKVKKPYEADLFSNEPPPLDEVDESPLFGSVSSGNKYMSSAGGLFDDLGDDDNLWSDTIPKVSNSNFPTQSGNVSAEPKVDSIAKKSTISRGLFDDDSDIDDIFTTNITKPPPNLSYLSKPTTTMPLVDNEPPSIENEPSKKKAVGGVPIFGKQNDILSKNLSKVLKTPKQASSSSESDNEDISKTIPKTISGGASTLSSDTKADDLRKGFSLFTDTEPKKDESQKFKGLFDDEDDDNFDFLVSKSTKKTETTDKQNNLKKKEDPTKPTLTDKKTDPGTSEKELGTKIENPPKIEKKTLDSLFYDDEPPPLDDEIDQKESFKNDATKIKTTIDLFKEIDDDLFKQDLFRKEKKTSSKSPAKAIDIFNDDIFDNSKNSNSLFDEPPDMSDSERSDTSSKKSISTKFTDMKETEQTENIKTETKSKIESTESIKSETIKPEITSKFENKETVKNEKTETISKIESKLLDKNLESVKDKFESSKSSIRTSSSKENIGKISHNLNINVGALLPGSVRPKQNKSNEVNKEESDNKSNPLVVSKKEESDTKTSSLTASMPNLSVSHQKMVKSVSFDEPTDNVETLQSLTQERARIPVKRRPSTRRARQQAIRASLIDDTDNNLENDDQEVEEKLQDNKISKEEEINNEINDVLNGNSNEQSPKNISNKTSIDDNDLFSNKQQEEANDNESLFSNEPENIFNDPLFTKDSTKSADKNDIFNDSSESDQLVINKSTDTSFASNKSTNVLSSFLDDLNTALKFDDQDDIDDIFNINKNKKPKSKTTENTSKNFDDDSSDLFSDIKKNEIPKANQNTVSKQSTLLSDVDSDLFDENISKVSVKEPKVKEEKKSTKISLFDDDEDDDLFKPIKKTELKSSEKSKETKENLKAKSIPKKTSIFDDDDDSENDLFGSGTQKKSSKSAASISKSDSTSGKAIKKPSSKVVFDDPLMFNDD